jgi:hypothetical protein
VVEVIAGDGDTGAPNGWSEVSIAPHAIGFRTLEKITDATTTYLAAGDRCDCGGGLPTTTVIWTGRSLGVLTTEV